MANIKFPSDMAQKTSLESADSLLIADSAETFTSKSTTVQSIVDLIGIDTKADITYVDSQLLTKADKVNVLELDNTTSYSPSADYHPVTKLYVDSLSGSSGQFVNVFTETLAGQVTQPDLKTYNHFHYDVTISSTVGNPLGGIDATMEGYTGTLILRQDSSGSNTISFGSDWLFPLGAPTINTGGDAMNIFKYTVVYNGVNYMIFAEFVASYIGDSTGGGYC